MSLQDVRATNSTRRRRSPRTSKSNENIVKMSNSDKALQRENSGTIKKNPSLNNIHRTNSRDNVRKLVEKEGRSARNLVTWSVPVSDTIEGVNKKPKPKFSGQKRPSTPEKSGSSEREGSPASKQGSKSPQRLHMVRKLSGSSSSNRKSDLRARYWCYLFDNLKRAVDEIYCTCESDKSTVECQEVIMMLDQCRRDFSALIDRINVQDAFEKADHKDRPTSLAWEVRKSSPGKTLALSPVGSALPPSDRNSVSPARSLDFEPSLSGRPITPADQTAVSQNSTVNNIRDASKGLSWADKVKGSPKATVSRTTQTSSSGTPPRVDSTASTSSGVVSTPGMKDLIQVEDITGEDSDGGGWETVHRGKKNHHDLGNKQLTKRNYQRAFKENIAPTELRFSSNRPSMDSCAVRNNEPSAKENIVHNGIEDVRTVKSESTSTRTTRSRSDDEDDVLAVPLDYNDIEQDCASTSDVERDKAISDVIQQEESVSKEREKWHEQAIAAAIAHEESLNKEIADEEAFVTALNGEDTPTSEVEGETEGEGDGNEGDAETENESSLDFSGKSITWDEMIAKYDREKEINEDSSWGDMMEQAESRQPGRAVQMHQKLSSPSRKKTLAEKIRIHEEKQAKAHQQRERLIDERLQKLQMLSEKVRKVQELKDDLIHQKHLYFEEKLKRAEEQRQLMLREKIRKAQEEEAKVNEIAFINTLEAQNKKIEVLTRHQGHEARLQDLQEERQRKKEEQLAKEAAAQERRRQLEADRQARLEEMQQRRLEQEARYQREKMEKERAREEAARQKEKEREMRIAARNEALQTATEQLQLKIQQKQTESTKRHEQQLEQVKEKAAGVSRHSTQEEIPTGTPYDKKKFCSLCNVEIVSEVYLLSHLRGKFHIQALTDAHGSKCGGPEDGLSLQYIKDMPPDKSSERDKADFERQKALKKRAKKLRTRMAAKGREYEGTISTQTNKQRVDSAKKPKLQKIVKDLNRYLQTQGSGPWPTNRVAALERSAGELNRILESRVTADQVTFRQLGGLAALSRILLVVDITCDKPPVKPVIPNKPLCGVVNVMVQACSDCLETSQYMVYSNKLGSVVDLLVYQFKNLSGNSVEKKPGEKDNSPGRRNGDALAIALLNLLASVFQSFATSSSREKESSACMQRTYDLISYIVCAGVVDDMKSFFSSIRGPCSDEPQTLSFVVQCLRLLSSITQYLGVRSSGVFDNKKEDLTQFIVTYQQTDVVGKTSLLYTMLLYPGQQRHSSPPPDLPDGSVAIAMEAFCTLNNMAVVDLKTMQSCLGAEGTSLEFRHLVSHLIWMCSEGKYEDLLHEVILAVGYFTVLNPDNQVFVQSGRNPTLLRQMCGLPFQYFSDPSLRNVLFPSLISACFNNEENKKIVEQEVSCALLENYLEDKMLDSQHEKLLPSQRDRLAAGEDSLRFSLVNRFPVSRWTEAIKFLKGSS